MVIEKSLGHILTYKHYYAYLANSEEFTYPPTPTHPQPFVKPVLEILINLNEDLGSISLKTNGIKCRVTRFSHNNYNTYIK